MFHKLLQLVLHVHMKEELAEEIQEHTEQAVKAVPSADIHTENA